MRPSHEGGETEERSDIFERGHEEEHAEDTRKGNPTGGENEQGRAKAKVNPIIEKFPMKASP